MAAVIGAGALPAQDTRLIRIDKIASAALSPETRAEIQPVKDLGGSWLALISGDGARRLDESAAPFEILDRNPNGKAYFLVRASGGDSPQELAAFGSFRLLGDRTALFWTDGAEAREILPSRWTIVRLRLDDARPLAADGPSATPAPRPSGAVTTYDPTIAALAAQVSKIQLTARISDLQDFHTRYVSTAACEAAGTYLYNEFVHAGLAAEYDPFTISGGRYATRNIVATLSGKTAPDRLVIVCGHYDSTSNQASTLAPGADDNGSGAAAVLEIARVLAGHDFDYTLRFICFSAEEWGLYGSAHYAQAAKAGGEKIIAVINMDMIGVPDPYADRMDVVINGGSQWLFDRYAQAASTYAGMRTRKILDNAWDYSDQSPFWDYGYSALCGIENENPSNPNYHKTTDLLTTLNMDFATAVTRASLSAAADLAQPIGTPRMPTGLQVRSQIIRSLYVGVKTVVLRWNANADSVVGYNVYRAEVSGGPYEKINATPVPTPDWKDRFLKPAVIYYYVVTAVDAQGRESRSSLEASDSQNPWVN